MKKIIKIGCCGWARNRSEYFKNFNLIEIQETFYQPPQNTKVFEHLREIAPENFEFSVKAWQIITHLPESPTYKKLREKNLNLNKCGFFKPTKEVFSAYERILDLAKILKARVILFQTPSSFSLSAENLKNFQNFFQNTNRENFLFAWEPRGVKEKSLIKKLCQKLNLIHCVDPFKEKPLWGSINYFRLHGKPNYNLNYVYNKDDFKKLFEFSDKKENYILFNNISMFENARFF